MKKYTFDLSKLSDFQKTNLRDFVSSWLEWAKAGGEPLEHIAFTRAAGLCSGAAAWDCFIGSPLDLADRGMTESAIFRILSAQAERGEVESRHYPFNEGSHTEVSFVTTDYYRESNRRECHLNAKRLASAEALFIAADESLKEKS